MRWAERLAGLALLLALLPACSTTAAAARSAAVGPYEVEILVDGSPRTVYVHGGRWYVAGRLGERYEIRVRNHTGQRVEAVVSVDGRDVVDGRPASVTRRGYLLEAWGSATIDGFRTSTAEVAAFRFSTVDRSYAARMGSAANVGVIGVALFPERPQPVVVQPPPPPPPYYYPEPWAEGQAGARGRGDDAAAGDSLGTASQAPAAGAAEASKSGGGQAAPRRSVDRPGLGTSFGERRSSQVQEVPFERADPGRPAATISLRYDDWQGLVAAGVVPPPERRWSEQQRREAAEPFPADGRFAQPPPGY